MGYIQRVLNGEDTTRRQAVKALGAAATTGAIAGCSTQAQSETGVGGQPNQEPEPEPEDNTKETQPEETENQYQDFNPEPMSLLEITQKASMDASPRIESAFVPQALHEAYGDILEDNPNNLYSPRVGFPFESGMSETASPVGLYQNVQKGPSLVVMQLQENFPRRRIGENFEQAGLETLISEDDFDVYSDGKAAQVVNDEILATIWHSRANKEPNSYIDEIKTYAENYGQNSLTPEIEELANDLDGEDFLTMHFEDSEKYMPIARESVQPEGAVMRGNMGEGVETAWIYENPTLAEAAAEYVRDKPDGANYENQATQKSNIMIASGNEEVIENSLNGSTRITAIGVPHI